MAGVNVETGGGGGRRSIDSEINMIPMIDLLMVTISFLLITAVWTHMARVDASAQVPGPPEGPVTPRPQEKQLHIDMKNPEKFTLVWKQGNAVVRTVDVARGEGVAGPKAGRKDAVVRYPELARTIRGEWESEGVHRAATDGERDRAVLHTDASTPYSTLIAVIDAVYATERARTVGTKSEAIPAFNASFSVD